MQAEIDTIASDWAAFEFAIGCLIACGKFRLDQNSAAKGRRLLMTQDRFFASASIAGVSACLLGLFYLYAAGAPASMLLINGGALILGLLLALLLEIRRADHTPRSCSGGLVWRDQHIGDGDFRRCHNRCQTVVPGRALFRPDQFDIATTGRDLLPPACKMAGRPRQS